MGIRRHPVSVPAATIAFADGTLSSLLPPLAGLAKESMGAGIAAIRAFSVCLSALSMYMSNAATFWASSVLIRVCERSSALEEALTNSWKDAILV
jgi:hypothetical protein